MELSANFELIEYTPFLIKLTCIILVIFWDYYTNIFLFHVKEPVSIIVPVIFMFVEYQAKQIFLHTKIASVEEYNIFVI